MSQGMNSLLFVGFSIAEDPMEKRLKVLFRSVNDKIRCSTRRLIPLKIKMVNNLHYWRLL